MIDTRGIIILYISYDWNTRKFILKSEEETEKIESEDYRRAALKLAIRIDSDNYDYLVNNTKKISIQNKHYPAYSTYISYSKEEIADILLEGGV